MNLDATGDINSDGFEGVVVKASLSPASIQSKGVGPGQIYLMDEFYECQVFEYDPSNSFPSFNMNVGETLPDGIWAVEKPEVVYIDIAIAAIGQYSSNIDSTFKASIGSTNVSNVFSADVPVFDIANKTKTYDLSAYDESLNELIDDTGVIA